MLRFTENYLNALADCQILATLANPNKKSSYTDWVVAKVAKEYFLLGRDVETTYLEEISRRDTLFELISLASNLFPHHAENLFNLLVSHQCPKPVGKSCNNNNVC